jgi:hypothetical protein
VRSQPAGGQPELAELPELPRPHEAGRWKPRALERDLVRSQLVQRVAPRAPRIAIGDVGQNQFEELDYTTVAAAGGANFGWYALEGFRKYEDENSGTPDPGGTVKPIFAYPHSRGGSCSIIGGYVVRDPALPPLRGRYVYADLCEGELRSLVPGLGQASGDRKLGLRVESPSSFGEDDAHRLYVSSISGPVYRLVQR